MMNHRGFPRCALCLFLEIGLVANFNQCVLAGRVTRDPQLAWTASNVAVLQAGLAVNRKWRNPQGQVQEEVSFIDFTAFGKSAETLNQYVRKGDPLLISGRIKQDVWTDKQGQNRSRHKIIVESFQFLKGPPSGGQQTGESGAPPQQQQAEYRRNGYADSESEPAPPQEAPPIEDGDIPF
jgi:single-strand DNA-binding protein